MPLAAMATHFLCIRGRKGAQALVAEISAEDLEQSQALEIAETAPQAVALPAVAPHRLVWPRVADDDSSTAALVIFGTILAGFICAAFGLAWMWLTIAHP